MRKHTALIIPTALATALAMAPALANPATTLTEPAASLEHALQRPFLSPQEREAINRGRWFAALTPSLRLVHEPPRTTRKPGSRMSSTHSDTLPDRSSTPRALAPSG